MLAGLLLAVCTPLPTCSPVVSTSCASPTPVLTWDKPCLTGISCWLEPVPPGEDCAPGCYDGGRPDGYVMRWQRPGVPFDDVRRMVLPCFTEVDEFGAPVARRCPARDIGYPVQRFCSAELEEILYEVSAYIGEPTVANEGPPSNVVSVCHSQLCRAPGPCN